MQKRKLTTKQLVATVITAVVLIAGVIVCLSLIPAVQDLGTKVKLPMFHGASTWADLMVLALLGIVSITVISGREHAYGWEVGLRVVGLFMWFVNAILGYVAARNTWDFSASKQNPFFLVMQDPRLMAQVYLCVGAIILFIVVGLILSKRKHKAIADLVYVVIAAGFMANLFLDPAKSALHPDNPVLNSTELIIKLPFFGIVAGVFLLDVLLAWVISRYVAVPPKPPLKLEEPPAPVIRNDSESEILNK